MQKKQPTKKQLKQLFQLSKTLYKSKPWEYLPENLAFGIELPNVNAYVCFIGKLGETMGMIAYLGEEAINRIKYMNCPETLINTPMLALTFDSEEELDEADSEIADRIGFYFEDIGFCPSFRVNEPGYFPWTFCRENCKQFIVILQQAIQVIRTSTTFTTLLTINEEYKTSLFRKIGSDGKWVSTQKEIPSLEDNYLLQKPSEEILNEVRKLPVVIDTIQAGCLILPTPLGNEERPKVGYFFMLVDEKTEQVIAHDLFPSEPDEPTILERIFSILGEQQLRPKTIAIAEDNLLHDLILEMQPFELPVQILYKESIELLDKLTLELFNSIDEEYENEQEHGSGCGCENK